MFLVVIDAYSKFLEVSSAIAALRHFELFWFIQHLVTDNGSHLTNDEFQQFLKENDIFYHDSHCSWTSCDQWVSGTQRGIIQG